MLKWVGVHTMRCTQSCFSLSSREQRDVSIKEEWVPARNGLSKYSMVRRCCCEGLRHMHCICWYCRSNVFSIWFWYIRGPSSTSVCMHLYIVSLEVEDTCIHNGLEISYRNTKKNYRARCPVQSSDDTHEQALLAKYNDRLVMRYFNRSLYEFNWKNKVLRLISKNI